MRNGKRWSALVVGVLLALGAHAQDEGEGTAQIEAPTVTAPAEDDSPSSGEEEAEGEASIEEEDAEVQAQQFGRELRTVEEDVSALKERVFRSKATLQLLKERRRPAVAQGAAAHGHVRHF